MDKPTRRSAQVTNTKMYSFSTNFTYLKLLYVLSLFLLLLFISSSFLALLLPRHPSQARLP